MSFLRILWELYWFEIADSVLGFLFFFTFFVFFISHPAMGLDFIQYGICAEPRKSDISTWNCDHQRNFLW